jgi:hypothetical protein
MCALCWFTQARQDWRKGEGWEASSNIILRIFETLFLGVKIRIAFKYIGFDAGMDVYFIQPIYCLNTIRISRRVLSLKGN